MLLVTEYTCNIPVGFACFIFKRINSQNFILVFFLSISIIYLLLCQQLHCSFLVSSLFNRPICKPALWPGQEGAKVGNILL